ncbi:MAG: hypothetical protein WCH43_09255 [Verrucomicrobiota bacterium]
MIAMLILAALSSVHGGEIVVTIDTRRSDPRGIELIVAETNGKTYSTEAITEKGSRSWKWTLDLSKGETYVYLNHFYGSAYISVDADGKPVFAGLCQGAYKGNQRLTDISKTPKILKNSGFPCIVPAPYEPVSFIRFSETK